MRILSILLLVFVFSARAQVHNTIMPQPQKLTYGEGKLMIKGLTIGFASKPGEEDKFAANELSEILSKISASKVIIDNSLSTSSNRRIIFQRTANLSQLPEPVETHGGASQDRVSQNGPDSRESYKIKITGNSVRITAPSSTGLFYAVQTLRQMIEGSGDKAVLPAAEIEDWPSLAYRGFMMDMSHAQLPRLDELKKQIDFLVRWKTNQYYFYSEGSIELDGYPLLMADARYTKDQVREIIEYARKRHIDVIPNLELYGHLHDLFRLEHYSDMAVIPHGGEFKLNDPRTKPLLTDWVTQIAQLFPSPFFHIGFDETRLIQIEARKINRPAGEVYLEMLNQVTGIVEKQGKRPMVWADMLQKFPSIIPQISPKIIAVPWHYSPLTDEKYQQALNPFAKSNIEMIVQSAIMNYNWFVPDFETSFKNTDALIAAGKKYNASGYINSGWTDDTQTLMRMGYPDMAYGSIASWQNQPMDRENFFRKYAQAQYSPVLAEQIEKAHTSLMKAGTLLRQSLGLTDLAFWANPFSSKYQKLAASNLDKLREGRLAAEDAQIYIRSALKSGIDTTSLISMLAGAQMLDYLAMKYIYASEIAGFWKQMNENPTGENFWTLITIETRDRYHSRISDMLDAIMITKEIYKRAWLNEYTPFRLGVGLGKYDLEFQYWLKLQRRLENLPFKSGEPLPPLEQITDI